MNVMTVLAITITGSGLLIWLVCLPLMFRKVPMNGAYGIRIPAAFESDERWYEINEYGGRRMGAWAWLIVVAGLVGFFVEPKHKDTYGFACVAVTLVALLIPIIQIFRWSRRSQKI